jgi:nucleolar protein 4
MKLLPQLKVLEDKNKVDAAGKPKSSGIGFIEVGDHRLAMYFINNMNNFIMNNKNKKGLILDFSLEDHRKLLKRKQKIESLKKKLKEAKEGDDKDVSKK